MMAEAEAKRKELINLKQHIDHNKEMMQARVNKKRFEEEQKARQLQDEFKQIAERGENPHFFIPRRLKLEEIEKQKSYAGFDSYHNQRQNTFNIKILYFLFNYSRKFEEEKAKNTQEIIKKLVREEEIMEKKLKRYPVLFAKTAGEKTITEVTAAAAGDLDGRVKRDRANLSKLNQLAYVMGFVDENVNDVVA